MATLTVTIANGQNPRAVLDRLHGQIKELAQTVPDVVTGGATVLTFDNNPSSGAVTVQITSGPHSTNSKTFRA